MTKEKIQKGALATVNPNVGYGVGKKAPSVLDAIMGAAKGTFINDVIQNIWFNFIFLRKICM